MRARRVASSAAATSFSCSSRATRCLFTAINAFEASRKAPAMVFSIIQDHLFLSLFRKLELSAQPSSLENGLRECADAVNQPAVRGKNGREIASAHAACAVIESWGKNCARATPMRALAAMSCCSACRISGRRSSNREGRPTGKSCGTGASAFGSVWVTGPGFCPSSKPQRVLLLLDLLFELRNLHRCCILKFLSLAQVS